MLPEDHSIAAAWSLATRIMAISATVVIPIFIGYWIDSKLGTLPIFVLISCVIGMILGGYQLVNLVK